MRKILLLFGLLFLYSCAKLQYEKTYLINRPKTLAMSRLSVSLVFLDSNKVSIQTDKGGHHSIPAESMGKWQKKRNKITVKSDLQSDSASNSTYRKVEKKLNTTRSLDTVYIYALDTLGSRIWLTEVDFEGISEEFSMELREYLFNLWDIQAPDLQLKPGADVAVKIPKSVFLSIPYIVIQQNDINPIPDNDCVTWFGYVIEPKDTQFNEFFFYLKNSEEFWGYAYADWTYYLWPDGRLCSRTYGYYRKIKFRRFIRKAFPFTKKWFPKQFKYVDFFGHCLLCQNEK